MDGVPPGNTTLHALLGRVFMAASKTKYYVVLTMS